MDVKNLGFSELCSVKTLIYCKLKYLIINKMPLTEKQKKLPEGLQKAILAKEKKGKAPAKKAPVKKPVKKMPKSNY